MIIIIILANSHASPQANFYPSPHMPLRHYLVDWVRVIKDLRTNYNASCAETAVSLRKSARQLCSNNNNDALARLKQRDTVYCKRKPRLAESAKKG